MPQSQKQIIRIPTSPKVKTNLRKHMKSFSKTSFEQIVQHEDKVPMKFKEIINFDMFRKKENSLNELDMKYHIYNHGSPNFYTNSIETHKANILRNQVKSLELPFIDGVIQQIRNSNSKQNSTNSRNYQLYPNSLKNHISHKFKDLLSDKQEISDFLQWFDTNCSLIQSKNIPQMKKFQQKQIIISSGFSQIIHQLAKLSKTRSQVIKLLWNKQAQEVQNIVNYLTSKVIEMQKSHLIESSQIHQIYQRQIDALRLQNEQLSYKLQRQTLLNSGYINTFRISRRVIKKQQFCLKKLFNLNESIVQENLNLIDINTQLLLNQSKSNSHNQYYQQLKYSEGKAIIYRKLQVETKKSVLKQTLHAIKKYTMKKIQVNSAKQVQTPWLSELEIQDKKASLYNYLLKRMQQNPNDKLSIGNDFLNQDEDQIKTDDIQSAIKRIIDSKNIQSYLQSEQTHQGD